MPDGQLDTNVMLRAILGDIPLQHGAALKLLSTGTYVVSILSIAEVGFVLTRNYAYERASVALVLQQFIGLPNIESDSSVILRALDTYARHPALSLEDCLLEAEAASHQNGPLWTFDKKLASQSTARLVE